jgi:hypothetical protein
MIMKKSLLLSFATLLVVGALNSCKDPETVEPLTLTAGQTTQSVFADQEKASGTVSFTTAGAWTSSVAETTRATSWVTVTPSSGSKAGDYTIEITLQPNYTGSDRTATVTIASGGETLPITVTQKAVTETGEILVEEIAVTGVTLDKTTIELIEGESAILTATVAPENASNKEMTWSSSDEAVAIVDAEGKVTALKAGTATVTVTTADGGKAATCAVTVESKVDVLTMIPDPEFLAYCKEQMTTWDANGDGKLSPAEAAKVQSINVVGEYSFETDRYGDVASLEGIEYFTGLAELNCFGNQLSSLDVSKNTALTYLSCGFNQLISLDVSKNTALIDLRCAANQLSSLDVSKNTALTDLICGDNQLTSLDLSTNTALDWLNCGDNQLTSLDVSKNTALTKLECGRYWDFFDGPCNQLTSLDLSKNTALTYLDCSICQLTSLNVSGCTSLRELYCQYNLFTSIDVSGCTTLEEIHCAGSQLTSIDVSQNAALKILSCGDNQLTSLDVSANTALEHLAFNDNGFTSIDVSNNPALISLSCNGNNFTSIDVSNNPALTSITCWDNQLTSLDVSKNTALTYLYCWENQLASLDLSNNTALEELKCADNQLSALDVSKNTALFYLWCWGNQLTSLDISRNRALIDTRFYDNPGDGVSKFPVTAWFDNNSIPRGTAMLGTDGFDTGSWSYNGVTITPYYYTE